MHPEARAWEGESDFKPGARDSVDEQARALLAWVETLEREGLTLPLTAIRGAIDTARRSDDPAQAYHLVEQTSRLLNRTQERWSTLRDLLNKEDLLRGKARGFGIDTAPYDRRVASVRVSMRSGPLSEALFGAMEDTVTASIMAFEQAIAEHAPKSAPSLEDATAKPAAYAPTSSGLRGLRSVVVSCSGRAGLEGAGLVARRCPGCGADMKGSYCRPCRMVWVD